MDASEKRRASVERAACWPRDCSYFQRVGEGVGEDRRRGKRKKEGKMRNSLFSARRLYFLFGIGEMQRLFPPEDALFLIARIRIDNARLVYKGGPLWETLVPWRHCDATRCD